MAVSDDVLLDPAVLEQPYDSSAALRQEAPVHLTPFGFWLVSRYDDVMSIARDPARFDSVAMPEDDGTERGLTVPELLNVIEQLLVAGNETTTKRVAMVDVEVGGVAVPAGSLLFVMYGCANRDDGHFPGAASFDVHRANARTHLAFGQGPHFCVGASLARAEGRIAFETLLDLEGWALAGPPPEREVSMVLRGLSRLDLTFTPEEPRA